MSEIHLARYFYRTVCKKLYSGLSVVSTEKAIANAFNNLCCKYHKDLKNLEVNEYETSKGWRTMV